MKTWVKVLLYIVSLIFLGPIGIVIAFGLVKLIEKKKINSKKVEDDANIVDFKDYLFHMLDMALNFKKAYHHAVPDEWFILFLSQDTERTDYSERHYTYDGYIKIEILVGNWWKSILRKDEDICDTIMSLFIFDENEKSFTYKMRTGSCTCCPFPRDAVNQKLQKYLDEYEHLHPDIKFKRKSGSASIEFFP